MRFQIPWFACLAVFILCAAGLPFSPAAVRAASTDTALPPATEGARYFELKPGATVKYTCSSSIRRFAVCDGDACTPLLSQPCAPYGCDAKGEGCATSCASDQNCAEGSVCATLTGKCAWMPTRCVDAFAIKSPNGQTQSCTPYKCLANKCQQQCQTDGDCFTSYVCEDHVACVFKPSQGSAGGGAPSPSGAGTSATGQGQGIQVMVGDQPAQGESPGGMPSLGQLPGTGGQAQVSGGPQSIAGAQSVGVAAAIPAPEGGSARQRGSETGASEDCAVSVPYLKPERPVIETAGSALLQGDEFRILCRFRREERNIDTPRCDAAGVQVTRRYREQLGWSARNRYSGLVDVDGMTVRVAASPAEGIADFEIEHYWSARNAGRLVIACKVDNALRDYIQGSETYLEETVTVDVGAAAPARSPVRASELPARRQVPPQDTRRLAPLISPAVR